MIDFVSTIFCICVAIIIIGCTIVLLVFGGLLILEMLDESGFLDFLQELKNNKSNT